MSWFVYDYSGKDEKRSHRKGVWLRIDSTSLADVYKEIKASRCLRAQEVVQWIEVKELRPKNEVLLQIWACESFGVKRFKRYNVFHILMKENPDWTCEGDLGRGYVESK